jgi:hypothetical protein
MTGYWKKRNDLAASARRRRRVTEALQEYIQHRKQAMILELFGTVEFDRKHDYKNQRGKS